MEVKVIEDEPKSFVLEIIGADRGIAELLKDKLMKSKDVEFAGVVKEHPEIGMPRLVIKSSKNAKSLVLKAVEEVQEDFKEIAAQMPKAK